MATSTKTLRLIASKLGHGENDKVLAKSAEFERLLQTKFTSGNNISDTAKVVICLDLAAGVLGADLDLKMAVKYSGLKLSMYTNYRKMVQNLLELNSEKLTTSVLCAALQCMGVQDLAEQILEAYWRQAKMEIDLNLPQYVCMAVFHACRLNKVKISKAKITEKSRLKPAQWAKLDEDWTKFVDQHFTACKKKRGRPPKVANENVEPETMELDTQKEETLEPQTEPYEDWKRRMLEEAYRELREHEKIEAQKLMVIKEIQKTPRRSPRKTPQKYSPYKSPDKKGKGVRLLFPVDI